MRRVLEGCGRRPRVAVTDTLTRYPPAIQPVLPGVGHRRHKRLNDRAETSHRPVRKRERARQRFTSPGHAQRFPEPFSAVGDHVRPRRHRLPAPESHQLLQTRFVTWREATGLAAG